MSGPKKTSAKNSSALTDPAHISTGSLALDLALGGGWPCGRIVEVFGVAGSGKTTLLLEAIASAQRDGGMGAFIDADHGISLASAARLGLELDRMPYVRTNRLEEAFEKIDELARSGSASVIALDSIAALMPDGHDKSDSPPYQQNQGHQSKIEHYLKVLLEPLALSGAVLLISNQIREKVGIMFGSPETTPWETMPLRDYASVRVSLSRSGQIKDGDAILGSEVRAKVLKSRLTEPFTQVEFPLLFATGISRESELLALGLEGKILTKRGVSIFYDSLLLGQGQTRAAHTLKEDPELASRLRKAIIEQKSP